MHKATKENLMTAMHGEAFAYAKYTLFAKRASESGNEELAKLFQDIANMEFFEHFSEEAELADLVGSNEENLQNAISGERYEVKKMYKDFADAAAKAGDSEVAARFSEIRNDEKKHEAAYKAMLDKIRKPVSSTTM